MLSKKTKLIFFFFLVFVTGAIVYSVASWYWGDMTKRADLTNLTQEIDEKEYFYIEYLGEMELTGNIDNDTETVKELAEKETDLFSEESSDLEFYNMDSQVLQDTSNLIKLDELQ